MEMDSQCFLILKFELSHQIVLPPDSETGNLSVQDVYCNLVLN